MPQEHYISLCISSTFVPRPPCFSCHPLSETRPGRGWAAPRPISPSTPHSPGSTFMPVSTAMARSLGVPQPTHPHFTEDTDGQRGEVTCRVRLGPGPPAPWPCSCRSSGWVEVGALCSHPRASSLTAHSHAQPLPNPVSLEGLERSICLPVWTHSRCLITA